MMWCALFFVFWMRGSKKGSTRGFHVQSRDDGRHISNGRKGEKKKKKKERNNDHKRKKSLE